MKTLFAIVLLAAVVLSSEAAPSHGVQLYKNDIKMLVLTEAGNGKLHDIWSICSKTSHNLQQKVNESQPIAYIN